MALSHFVAILLVLLPIAAKATVNGFPPIQSPFLQNVCNEVHCGRGTCEAAPGSPFNFKCDCDDGWRRTRSNGWNSTRFHDDDDHDDDDHLEFLPCIIPNCSLDYSCMPASPPAPAPSPPYNLSFFEPCNWVYCGEGRCTRNTTYTHTCQCNPGASNLFNISSFPCYSDCAIGQDCGRLGIRTANSNSNPSSSSNDNNLAMALSLGKFNWMIGFLISSAIIFLK